MARIGQRFPSVPSRLSSVSSRLSGVSSRQSSETSQSRSIIGLLSEGSGDGALGDEGSRRGGAGGSAPAVLTYRVQPGGRTLGGPGFDLSEKDGAQLGKFNAARNSIASELRTLDQRLNGLSLEAAKKVSARDVNGLVQVNRDRRSVAIAALENLQKSLLIMKDAGNAMTDPTARAHMDRLFRSVLEKVAGLSERAAEISSANISSVQKDPRGGWRAAGLLEGHSNEGAGEGSGKPTPPPGSVPSDALGEPDELSRTAKAGTGQGAASPDPKPNANDNDPRQIEPIQQIINSMMQATQAQSIISTVSQVCSTIQAVFRTIADSVNAANTAAVTINKDTSRVGNN